jgi:hypothetical protein
MEPIVTCNTFYFSWHDAMKNLTKEQYGKLSWALNEYCFFGIEAEELEFPLDVLFTSYKPNIKASTSRKLAGKKGGAQGKGGAPIGNTNAKQNQNNSKTIANFKQNNTDDDDDIDEEVKEEEDDNEKPSSSFSEYQIQEKSKDLGFIISLKQAQDFISNLPDITWLEGEFNFLDYAAEKVRGSEKPHGDQVCLFVKTWTHDFFIQEYPMWREERIREKEADERKRAFEQAWRNQPKTCVYCGGEVTEYNGNFHCITGCSKICEFNRDSLKWEWRDW